MVDRKNQLVIGSALLALILVLTASYSRSSNPFNNNPTIISSAPTTITEFKPTQAQQLLLVIDEAEKSGRNDEPLASNHAIQASHGNHYLINYRAGRLYSLKENHADAFESYQKASALALLNYMNSSCITSDFLISGIWWAIPAHGIKDWFMDCCFICWHGCPMGLVWLKIAIDWASSIMFAI